MGAAGKARFEFPPLAPQCIIEQLELELLRLTGRPDNFVRQPSDETVASYLTGYRPRRTAPAAARGPAEAVWNAVAEARRLAWRVRRKMP